MLKSIKRVPVQKGSRLNATFFFFVYKPPNACTQKKLLFREQKPCDDRFLFYECVNTEIGFDLDDIVFETKCDAEAVLGQLMDIADNYGYVSVADYLDLSGVEYSNRRIACQEIKATRRFLSGPAGH